MSKDVKHFKFINNETDNVIYLMTVPADKSDVKELLEQTRHRLAVENGLYIGNIYYIEVSNGDKAR